MDHSIDRRCFQVEKIIGIHIGEDNSAYYQVQWGPTWEPLYNLVGCEHLIKDFWMKKSCQVLGVDMSNVKQEENEIVHTAGSSNIDASEVSFFCNNENDKVVQVDEENVMEATKDGNSTSEMNANQEIATTSSQLSPTPQARPSLLFPLIHGARSRKTVAMVCSAKRKQQTPTHAPSKRPCSISTYTSSNSTDTAMLHDLNSPQNNFLNSKDNGNKLYDKGDLSLTITDDTSDKDSAPSRNSNSPETIKISSANREKVFGSSPTIETASFTFADKVFEIHNEFMRFANEDTQQKVLDKHGAKEVEKNSTVSEKDSTEITCNSNEINQSKETNSEDNASTCNADSIETDNNRTEEEGKCENTGTTTEHQVENQAMPCTSSKDMNRNAFNEVQIMVDESIEADRTSPVVTAALSDTYDQAPKNNESSNEYDAENVRSQRFLSKRLPHVEDSSSDATTPTMELLHPFESSYKNKLKEKRKSSKQERRAKENSRSNSATNTSLSSVSVDFNKFGSSDKSYSCLSCKLRYKSASSLRKHCEKQHKKLLDQTEIDIKCNLCQRQFLLFKCLNDHVKGHSELTEMTYAYACGLCDDVFKSLNDLKSHAFSHEFDLFDSYLASVTTDEFDNLTTSDTDTDLVKPLHKCKTCSVRFAKKSDLEKHALKHVQNKMGYKGKSPASTPVKVKTFSATESKKLRRISKEKETQSLSLVEKKPSKKKLMANKVNKYSCNECESEFDTEKLLNKHITTHQTASPPIQETFSCPLCPDSKPKKGVQLFNIHCQKFHLNEETFPPVEGMVKCPSCLMFFPRRRGLLLHMCRQHDMKSQEANEIISLCVGEFSFTSIEGKKESENHKEKTSNNLKQTIKKEYKINARKSDKLRRTRNSLLMQEYGNEKRESTDSSQSAGPHERLQCKLCPLSYENEICLYRHVKVKHDLSRKVYKIKTSTSSFKKQLAQNNSSTHKTYPCLLCTKSYPCEYNLYRHAKLHHPKKIHKFRSHLPKIQCEKCNAKCINKKSLESHLERCHGNSVALESKERISEQPLLPPTVDETVVKDDVAAVEAEVTSTTEKVRVGKKRGRKPKLKFRCSMCPMSFQFPILLASHTRKCRNKQKLLSQIN